MKVAPPVIPARPPPASCERGPPHQSQRPMPHRVSAQGVALSQGDLINMCQVSIELASSMNAVRASMRCVCSCSSSSISSSRSEVVLADLGVSDMLDPHSRLRKKLRTTDSSIHVCTASYRSPDVGLGNYYFSVDVDMWSLGCVTAELHHGRTLFRGIGENPSSKSVINDMLKLLPPLPGDSDLVAVIASL